MAGTIDTLAEKRRASGTSPVLMRNVTVLYQNGCIVGSEKDFISEKFQAELRSGDYSPLYEYLLIKFPTAYNLFNMRMKDLMEQEVDGNNIRKIVLLILNCRPVVIGIH